MSPGGETKTCSHCAEEIKAEAKVCKHCGKNVLYPAANRWVRIAVIAIIALFAGWWLMAIATGNAG